MTDQTNRLITQNLLRLTACCAAVAVVSCLVSTLIFMLSIGIGLGYNYCYVDYTSGRRVEDEINSATTIDVNSIVEVTQRNTNNANVSKAIGLPARYKWYRYHPTPHWRRSERDDSYDYVSEDAEEIQTTEINSNSTITTQAYENNDTTSASLNEKTSPSKVYDVIVNEILKENAKRNNLSNTIELNENENSKLLIPISGLDLISLLSKWRAENRNYSLQIVVS
ncbi:unnamed protein product [Colias eurytheme]|nr:unnamed protein product [Colias eurytheme]